MGKVLMIIDAQYGFIEGGNLGVEGARDKMNGLVDFIKEHHNEYDNIYLSADWHLPTHCSFKDNGGIWPPHCVQFSHDAAIYQPILDALNEAKVDYHVLTKGCDEDHEEYSVFKNEMSNAFLKAILNVKDIDTVDFAGIALNYCVLDSIKDGKKVFTNAHFRLFKDFTPSIGSPDEALKEIGELGVEIV